MTDKNLIQHFAAGFDEQCYTTVALKGKRFVIFRIAGHMRWDGNWQPWAYEPVKHFLTRHGKWWMSQGTIIKEWHGRVSKPELEKALEAAEKKSEGKNDKSVRVSTRIGARAGRR